MSRQRMDASKAGVETYDVDGIVPGLAELPAGTNVLVSGPPMIGKERIALSLLAAGTANEHAIVVSPDTGVDRLRRRFADLDGSADRFHVVDCTGVSGKRSIDDEVGTKYVNSPGDLTGIGLGIIKCTRDVGADVSNGLRLGLFSLSTLSQYAEAGRVFNFLHTVTGRVAAADYLGVATLDPTTRQEREVNTLISLFDAVVELREADDGSRQVRVVGLPDAPRTWQTL